MAYTRRGSALENHVHSLEQSHPNNFVSLLIGLYTWGGASALRDFLAMRPRRNLQRFVERGCMFHHTSSTVSLWNWALRASALRD